METWSLQQPSWLRFLKLLPFFLLALATSLACACVGVGLLVKYAFAAGFDWLHFLIGLLGLIIALLFGFVCLWIVRDSFSQVIFSSQAIERRVFGKTHCLILWDELEEIGIALERWIVRGGPYRCLYFANRNLDETERAAIDEAFDKAKGGLMIRVPCKGLQNEEKLKEFCPLPLPSVHEPRSGKYALLSYRRSKSNLAAWNAPESVILPDAKKIVSRFREPQHQGN